MSEQYREGLEGERMAVRYLKERKVMILATRFRAEDGEVDIIAKEKDITCFIEVKYRPNARLGEALEAVTEDKRRRVRNAARAYCRAHDVHPPIRYDVMEITRAGIWHLKGQIDR